MLVLIGAYELEAGGTGCDLMVAGAYADVVPAKFEEEYGLLREATGGGA
jgi:hypothetical protein